MLLLLLWVPLVPTPKGENRLFYVDLYSVSSLSVRRGVGGSPRVMVQLARVVVGATRYYLGTIHTFSTGAAVLLDVLCCA